MLAGILVDVSSSIKNSLQLHVKATDENVTRAQSIFTTITNIITRGLNLPNDSHVFVLAFGLHDVPTCDLLALLHYVKTLNIPTNGVAYQNLIQLLESNGALSASEYVEENMRESEAHLLYKFYSENNHQLCEVIEKLNILKPPMETHGTDRENLIKLLASNGAPFAGKYVKEHLSNEEAHFLLNFCSKNIDQLRHTAETLNALTSPMKPNGHARKKLIRLLASNGASKASKYVRGQVSEIDTQFLINFCSENIHELREVSKTLHIFTTTMGADDDRRTTFIKLLASNGAPSTSEYVKNFISEKQVQFLFKFYSENINELHRIVKKLTNFILPSQSCIGDARENLIKLLASNGASKTSKYVEEYMSQKEAQFLLKLFSENIHELCQIDDTLNVLSSPIQTNADARENLIDLLADNTAPGFSKYVIEQVSKEEAEFLLQFYSQNIYELRKIIKRLNDLILSMKTNGDVRENLINFLTSIGAPNTTKYIKKRMSDSESQLVFNFYSKNIHDLRKIEETLNDIISHIQTNRHRREKLIKLLALNGAPYASEYVKKSISEREAQFLFKFYYENIDELRTVIERLTDLILAMQSNSGARENLIKLLASNGASKASKYVEEHISEREAQFLLKLFSENIYELCEIVETLNALTSSMQSNSGDRENLIKLLLSNGATYTGKYVKEFVCDSEAEVLVRFYSKNMYDLRGILNRLSAFSLPMRTNSSWWENFIIVLESNRALYTSKYVKRYMSERDVEFLVNFYFKNIHELSEIFQRLPALTSLMETNDGYRENLIKLLLSNGAPYTSRYVREDVSEKDAELLWKFYSENIHEIRQIEETLIVLTVPMKSNDDGRKHLIDLLAKHGARRAAKYVDEHVSEGEAQFLFSFYSKNLGELNRMVDDLPTACKEGSVLANSSLWVKNVISVVRICENKNTTEERMTNEHVKRAMKRVGICAMKHIKWTIKSAVDCVKTDLKQAIQQAKDVIYRKTVERLKTWSEPQNETFLTAMNLLKDVSVVSSELPRTQQSNLVDAIEPFIYGNTPMCEAIRSALNTFRSSAHQKKVLFLLSDGESTDGDPAQFAAQLCNNNVVVFVCLLTSENISHPRRLYYEPDAKWTKVQRQMFELSSTMENSHSAMSILLEQHWELATSGHSRLFIQANHPDVIKEFSNAIQYIAESNDVLLNMIGRVSLNMYINTANSTYEPNLQKDRTCYAHAVGTALHLAMHRIAGRENGVPYFADICEELIDEYGREGAVTKTVLSKWAPKYRLHYKKVNELGAREAINRRRPVVARFQLHKKQWNAFIRFYENHPQGVLETKDIGPSSIIKKTNGHAVVLVQCDPTSLTFINSWGTTFADGGLFRVRNQAVLNLQFYDVYWTLSDLKESEIQAFQRKSSDVRQKLPPGSQNLPYQCPQCHQCSSVNTFITHLLEAECPQCHQRFKPTPLRLNVNSYTH